MDSTPNLKIAAATWIYAGGAHHTSFSYAVTAEHLSMEAGAWVDVPSACKASVKITGSTTPDASQMDAYKKSYRLYQELYPALKSSFEKM